MDPIALLEKLYKYFEYYLRADKILFLIFEYLNV